MPKHHAPRVLCFHFRSMRITPFQQRHTTPLRVFMRFVMKENNSRSTTKTAITPMIQTPSVWVIFKPSMTGSNACASIRRYIVEFVSILDSLSVSTRNKRNMKVLEPETRTTGKRARAPSPRLFHPPIWLVISRRRERLIRRPSIELVVGIGRSREESGLICHV